jgi:hypothetical protein
MMSRFTLLLAVVGSLMLASAAPAAHHKKDHDWIKLFNGTNFDGWTANLQKGAELKDVYSVRENGVLYCKGKPRGVLRTKKNYSDYVIKLQWRWPESKGNNGLLVHTSDPNVMGPWPRSMEVQLMADNAGDFWKIGQKAEFPHLTKARDNGRNIKRRPEVTEKPLGQWNTMKVRCEGDTVTVWVNGTKANVATNITDADTGEPVTEGAISLQSEGTPVEFRDIRLRQLD